MAMELAIEVRRASREEMDGGPARAGREQDSRSTPQALARPQALLWA
jgi:hypothetical protein